MLRLIAIYFAIFILFVPVGIPWLLLCFLAGLFSPGLRYRIAMGFVRLITHTILRIGGAEVEVIGLENIPRGRTFFVSNHRGYADLFATYPCIPHICGTVSKIEWSRIPLLRDWMKMINCVFLDRSSARAGLECAQNIRAELEAGHSFMVYPEGTRNHEQTLLPFREGSFRPAFQTGTPVVPITAVHTDDFYELHKPRVTPCHITLVFGKPRETAGLDRSCHKAFIQDIQTEIQTTYDKYY